MALAALLASVSLLAWSAASPPAAARGILTPGGGNFSPATASVNAALAAAQQGAAVAAQASNELSRVTTALAAMQNLQSAARNLALASPGTVQDGLNTGGLVPDSGLASAGVANPVTWVGANTPTQSTASGKTTVTINQTAAQAILSWNSFNVGANTTVDFNQQSASWVALNQINATATPSQILGSIKAIGQVYLINPNGILFGGSSQVNVGALAASTAQLSNSQFLTNGIYSTQTGSTYAPSFTNAGGAITVQPGALISTNAPASVTAGGGFVLLLGKQVQNGGSISTPDGQTELAAGDNFLLRPGFGTATGATSTTRGNEVAVQLNTQGSSAAPGGSGVVGNTGIITASTGDITLAGEKVTQDGVLLATTSVDVRGTIHLLASASDKLSSVTLTGNSVTMVSPDLTSTATALDGQRAALIAQSAVVNAERLKLSSPQFDDLSLLSDQLDESRIEIVSGGGVEFQNNSQTVAQGGQVAVSAVARAEVDQQALIDVAGTYGVALAMQANDLAINVQSFEVRDSPQNRLTGNLRNNTLYVDINDLQLVPASSGGYATDRYYTPGGLIEASGYLNNVGHSIGEWTATGGSIAISTGAAGAVVAQTGAVFDIAGGSLAYGSGYLQQSYLLGTDGHIYNVNNAPSSITYAGVYDGFNVDHPHWGVTETYANVLGTPSQVYEAGYTVGRDAGSLSLSSPTTLFDGTIDAGTVNGAAQIAAAPAGTTDPYTLPQNVVATPGSLTIAALVGANQFPVISNVQIGAVASAAVDLSTAIPTALAGTTNLSASALNGFGLGGLSVLTDGAIAVTANLALAPGAAVSLFGSSVNIAAAISAPSGSVNIGNIITAGGTATVLANPNPPAGQAATGDVVLAPGAVIDTEGLWTNLATDPGITFTEADANGGAVTLISATNLTLGAGSMIDASAGAVTQAKGTQSGGAGGNISLTAGAALALEPNGGPGALTLGGSLQSIGFSKGGALTLAGQGFDITNDPAAPGASAVTLAPSFFTQGFSAYNLRSQGAVAIDPGTIVNVVEPTYQFTAASVMLPTGSAPASGASLVLNPLYVANPTLTALTQRPGASLSIIAVPAILPATEAAYPGLTLGEGAAINVDPGQSIHLEALGQMTIDGSLTAPGGNIAIYNDALLQTTLPGGPGALSIWLGADSVVDASAQVFTASNGVGESISAVPAGGSISIGAAGTFGAETIPSTAAAIIIRQGAVLEASGTSGIDQVAAKATVGASLAGTAGAGAPVDVQSAGGKISITSESGIYINGTLTAAAGGANAAGGTLALSLESDGILNTDNFETFARILTITQNNVEPVLPANLQPGASDPSLVAGTGQISAAQITDGGFGNVILFARDALSFAGNVTLSARQSISLLQGAITDTNPAGSVVINAPYVLLSGQTPDLGFTGAQITAVNGYSTQAASGTFTVNADLIDLANAIRFGGTQQVLSGQGVPSTEDLAGFGTEALNSAGDLRFVPPVVNPNGSPETTNLISTGNVSLAAGKIYSFDGTTGIVLAGYNPAGGASNPNGSFDPTKSLTFSRSTQAAQSAPLTIGGALVFDAATINQGGVIWQPLGGITFGSTSEFLGNGLTGSGDPRASINFLAGSLTSVSAAGLIIPYGGTTDGVTYDVNGQPVSASTQDSFGLEGVANGVSPGSITAAGLNIAVGKGAVLDLSGGGTLTGEGFISGANGSTDPLTTPLLNVTPAGAVSQPTLAADPVYAIVAGVQAVAGEAFTQTGATGSAPALGAQIIIPAGIPGLPAGRYTLLPAAYALTPGGYRVQFNGAASLAAPTVAALPNGSYAVAGQTGSITSAAVSTLPSAVTITPGATVRNYGLYDEENYSTFLQAAAARLGAVRPVLPEDAGTLILTPPGDFAATITDAGTTDFQAATGGIGGTLILSGGSVTLSTPGFDIYGASPAPNLSAKTVAVSAAALDAFNAFTLEIGDAGPSGQANTTSVTLENGAKLTAGRVVITALTGGITLKSGSTISTLGRPALLVDSTTKGSYSDGGASVLDVGNGYLTYSNANLQGGTSYGPITVEDGANIYTDGSIAFSTGAAVNIGVNANYGGRYLDLAVPEINVGDPAAVGATAAAGLTLTAAVLQRLTAGVPSIGLPATQILVLSADNSLNFFGTTALDLSGANVQLVIDSPAIYGFGAGSDVATISAATIVWNGVSNFSNTLNTSVSTLPGGVVANGAGTGAGTLNLDAGTIVLGYSDLDQPLRDVPLNRLTLGFSTVNLNATKEITANNQGTLAVYQSQANYGQPGTGGTLNLNTPLLTAANGATIGYTTGGALTVASTGAAVPLAGSTGGEIDLAAANVGIDGTVILPSGKLDIQAANGITLGAASVVNLAGQVSKIFDKTTYGFGGDLVMESAAGGITQNAGSVIDVSATGNSAGTVQVTATGAGGAVALNGAVLGSSTGGYASGSFDLRTAGLSQPAFNALNTMLNTGGLFQSRSFEIGQGDLTVGDGVTAHEVSISVDGGSLTVDGTINASGNGGGGISLAAQDNLTIAAGAALDAQGTTLVVDSYGQPIASENAPVINLTTATGELSLAPGAVLNLASADGVARGDLELNVPRLGSATSGDANISAPAGVNISGASTIAVNAFATYHGLTDPNSTTDGLITQAYLDQINSNDTLPFMQAAATNADLASRVAGLSAHGGAYQLRPGVQIVSATADGDLTVQGDINLAGYRYGPGVVTGDYGSGAPGVLQLRAGGNLNVYGSITDGFEQPINDTGTGFAQGWVLFSSGEPYGQNLVLPAALIVKAGSTLIGNQVNFAVPITGGTFVQNSVAPVTLTVQSGKTVTVAFVATSDITSSGGTLLFAKGAVVPAGAKIPAGASIAAGGTLPFNITVGPVIWPANTAFTVIPGNSGIVGVTISQQVTLAAGSLIPGGSVLKFGAQPGVTTPTDPNGKPLKFANGKPLPVEFYTRPVNGGTQGQLYPLAALLPAGYQSWSIKLVAGANTAAADPLAVRAASALAAAGTAGDITLNDPHYGITENLITLPPVHNFTDPQNHPICQTNPSSCQPRYKLGSDVVVPAFSVIRTGTGTLDLAAGGSIDEVSDYGVYTAGAQSAAITDGGGGNPYNLAQGRTGDNGTLLGASNAGLAALVANYQANYPVGGGNVLIAAQNALNGFVSTTSAPNNSNLAVISLTDTDAEGSWLWRQGGAGQSAAWWIEFGAFSLTAGSGQFGSPEAVQMDGFQGIGALGGGNLTVQTGGNAAGLNLAVGATGRVKADGTLAQTGGGALNVKIGGALNFFASGTNPSDSGDQGGLISDLRGATTVNAGSIGNIVPVYGNPGDFNSGFIDPRFISPLASEAASFLNGIDLAPGDSAVTVQTRGDMVIDGVGDPGTNQTLVNTTPVDFQNGSKQIQTVGGATTDFTLWTSATGLSLLSAGGDVAPLQGSDTQRVGNGSADALSNAYYYPQNLSVIAQHGNIDLGPYLLELVPSANGQLQMIAAGSILGTGPVTAVTMSGAALNTEATPFNPSVTVSQGAFTAPLYSNSNPNSNSLLLTFGADTPTSAVHAGDTQPALIYAGSGDIIDVQFGAVRDAGSRFQPPIQYVAAKPFDIMAARDIVASGSLASPDVFLNLTGNDITTVSAGRDIIESSMIVAGPGTLLVQAGRNLYQADQGTIESIGPLFGIDAANRNSGAGVTVIAGAGATGPDYSNFATQFLDPASTVSLINANQIIATNDASLYTWLQNNYGYTGPLAGAYAYFQTLSLPQQDVFLRQLYFAELNASGLEFNQASSVRYKSYLLGQDAIAALFPTTDASGQPITYAGDITMYGGSGIHTDFGGAIETLTPGGQTIIGVEGNNPPSTTGLITQGSGDIDVYAMSNVLLGQSRVLTTFGGNILIWSAQGNINAGRGAKTTVDYTPLQRVYDIYGNISLSPTVPSSGAGIATLNPIPSVPAGNINLVAPLGTVDAGEAGIRVSGNLNVAALHVANGGNISVGGNSAGVPVASSPNVGGLTSAGNAAGDAVQAAENAGKTTAPNALPSVWIVEILGYGGGSAPGTAPPDMACQQPPQHCKPAPTAFKGNPA